MLADIGTERAVLSGVCKFGKEGLSEVDDIINISTFTDSANQMLFKCMQEALRVNQTVDIAGIISASQDLSLYDVVAKSKKDIEFISSLFSFPIKLENLRNYAKRLAKLEFARKAQLKHKEAYDSLSEIKGTETLDSIVSLSEKPIFDLILEVNRGKSDSPELLGEGMEEYIEFLMNNVIENVGIPTPWPIYNAAIGGGLRRGGVTMIGARPKIGKAIPNTSTVYTPTGPKLMGDLKVGDLVCTPFGTSTNITNIFERKDRPVYKIYFDDGTHVLADKDHLWEVKKNRRSNKFIVLDTESIKDAGLKESDGRPKWHIRVTEPVLFEKRALKIDPYIMGCLLGDGTFRGEVSLTSNDDYISNRFTQYCKSLGLKVNQRNICFRPSKDTASSNTLTDYIRQYNLWDKNSHNKFIPIDYMLSSVEDRKELLRGLLDTDGHAYKHGIEYTTVSITLATQVQNLVRSLGGVCTLTERYTSYCKDKKFLSYRVRISFKNCKEFFSLPRKSAVAHVRHKPLTKKIVDIKYAGKADCRCITVEDSNELYLIDNFIVTHNSTLTKELALHTSNVLKIPTLVLDTEMDKKDQFIRSLASTSKIAINMIETGKFNKSDLMKGMVLSAYKVIKDNDKFFYKSIAGRPFEEVMSIIRRWILKEVGFDDSGKTKDCLVIYDYFKLMDKSQLNNLKEYEAMGYQISTFTDFTKEFDFPVMAFVQLNRQEDISQSDRLRWLCQSYTAFLPKDAEMMANDGGPMNGNRLLRVESCRFGPGVQGDDYINMLVNGDYNIVTELGLKSQLKASNDPDEPDAGEDA